MNEIKIVFQNEYFLAADKPEGLASISESDTSIETLHSILENTLNKKLFIVHRLDKEVSGIILFAKDSKTHKLLNQQFYERTIKKTYIALVLGNMKSDFGEINKSIREFGSGRMGVDEKKGKRSFTAYSVIDKFKGYSLLRLEPTTGRRHQLRVHLYAIGHPIVGDLRYGELDLQKKYSRLMLHAESLEMNFGNESILLKSNPPDTFTAELNKLKNNKIES